MTKKPFWSRSGNSSSLIARSPICRDQSLYRQINSECLTFIYALGKRHSILLHLSCRILLLPVAMDGRARLSAGGNSDPEAVPHSKHREVWTDDDHRGGGSPEDELGIDSLTERVGVQQRMLASLRELFAEGQYRDLDLEPVPEHAWYRTRIFLFPSTNFIDQ